MRRTYGKGYDHASLGVLYIGFLFSTGMQNGFHRARMLEIDPPRRITGDAEGSGPLHLLG